MTFGQKLQALRRKQGWSQEELANRMTVSRQAVSKWELNESTPDTENIIRISGLFGVTTDFLLMEECQDAVDPPVAMETLAKTTTRKRAKTTGLVCILAGVLVIGALLTLSQIIPSRMKSESYYPAGEMVFLNPDGGEAQAQEGSVQTSYITVKSFIPFLNTYYLHWAFLLGCMLIVYGVCSLTRHSKIRRNRKK